MVASSNDYDSCCDQYYTTFDGARRGRPETCRPRKPGLGPIGSDPVTVFDVKHHKTLHGSLNFFVSKDGEETCDGDVVVSPSKDGGLTWDPPVVVDQGVGCDLDKTQIFDDKEWMVTDNNPDSKFYGRTYLTWTAFLAHKGEYVSSAIWESHSDDGGKHWSKSQEISGNNKKLCTFQTEGHDGACDEDQISIPTVAPDGTVYVAFENSQNESLWEPGEVFENQYLLVKSKDGGEQLVEADVRRRHGGRLERLSDQRRRPPDAHRVPGTRLVAREHRREPEDGTLYLTFATTATASTTWRTRHEHRRVRDELDGRRQDLVVAVARRRGRRRPVVPVGRGQPGHRKIGVVYHDRGASNGDLYTTALAEGMPGSLVKTTVSTAASNPVDSIFFQAGDSGVREVRCLPRRLHQRQLRKRRARERRVDGHA